MSENQNQYKFDAVDLILYFWNRRWPIIIVGFATAIISAVVSLCMTERYKSEVILFPTAAGSLSQDLLSTSSVGMVKSVLRLGEDEELDQLMQVLQSDEIRRRIVEKYDLMNHYDIKPGSKYPYTQLYQKYSKNIVIKPTKFLSVSISVMDTDPKLAAEIANEISNLVDTVRNNMLHTKAILAMQLVEKEYNELREDIEEQEKVLDEMRKKGIVDYEKQAEALSNALGTALGNGNKSAANEIQKRLDELGKEGGAFAGISSQLKLDRERLAGLKTKLTEAQLDARQNLPHKYVVNPATVSEKKAYPVRWMIVVSSTITTVIALMLFMIIRDAVVRRIDYLKKN